MILAGLGLVPVMVLLPHAPSGLLMLFHGAWIVLGYILWSESSASAQQPSRVR